MKRVRISLLILAAILLCTLLPQITLTSHAETLTGTCGDNLTYSLNSDTGELVISGTGSTIQDEAFSENNSIKSVVIPSGVTTIGASAFDCCTYLESVSLPDTVTSIGDSAFHDCYSLTSISLPEKLTHLGTKAFSHCAMKKITIPEKLAAIPEHAFEACSSLQSINISNQVKSIGAWAFSDCHGLKKLVLGDQVADIGYAAFVSCNSLTQVTIPKGVTTINDSAFLGCNDLSSVTVLNLRTEILTDGDDDTEISYTLGNSSTTTIHGYPGSTAQSYAAEYGFAFEAIGAGERSGCCGAEGDNITWTLNADTGELTISGTGEMVPIFEKPEFCPWNDYRDDILALTVESGVTRISGDGFSGCENLKRVTIADSVATIGNYAFSNCPNLSELQLPAKLTEIGGWSFQNSKITSLDIPASVKSIGPWAFSGCKELKQVRFSEKSALSSVDMQAFSSCTKLNSIQLPNTVGQIEMNTFVGCTSLTEFVVPDSVKVIGYNAFGGCGLKEITLGKGLKELNSNSFLDCEDLRVMRILNPKCKIEWVGILWEEDYANPALTIYGHRNSTAQSFAEEFDFQFISLDLEAPTISASNVDATGKIKLTWEAVPGANAYKVYRSDAKDGSYTLMKTVTDGTSYVNTSAVAGKAYWYKVKAINTDLDISSKYSAVKSRTCDLPQPVVKGGHNADTGKNKLTWEAIDGAKEYKVYRSASKDSGYKLMKTTTELSYVNTGAKAGETWYYKVMAVHSKSAANSAYSEIKTITCDLPRPVVTISLSSGKPKLTWKAIEGAKAYKVYRSESKSSGYELIKTTTSLVYTNTKAVKGKTYYYKVMAIHEKSAANSAYSLIKSIKATK